MPIFKRSGDSARTPLSTAEVMSAGLKYPMRLLLLLLRVVTGLVAGTLLWPVKGNAGKGLEAEVAVEGVEVCVI